MLRAVWALFRVGSEQNPTPTHLFLLHIIYKNSHLPLYLPTTLLLPPNTITHHQPLALKINIKHFFQWKKSGFLENTLLSFILKNFFGGSWKQPEIERPFIWLLIIMVARLVLLLFYLNFLFFRFLAFLDFWTGPKFKHMMAKMTVLYTYFWKWRVYLKKQSHGSKKVAKS